MTSQKLLWATKELPYPPNFGGDILYSRALIEAFSTLTNTKIVTFRPTQEFDHPVDGVRLLSRPKRSQAMSLTSKLPWYAYRYFTSELGAAFDEHVSSGSIVVVDSLAMFPAALEATRRGLKFAYVSHNYEGPMRLEIAKESTSGLKRVLATYDAQKAIAAEEFLIRKSAVTTTITEEDSRAIRARHPECAPVCIPMAYKGPQADTSHKASTSKSNMALIAGSFHWIAKQINLRRFLEAISKDVSENRIRLRIAGSMPTEFENEIRSKYPNIDLRVNVDNIYEQFQGCDLGLVIDELGGGFKIKVLDYAFNNMPIAGYIEAMAGTGMSPGEHFFPLIGDGSEAVELREILNSTDARHRVAQNARQLVGSQFGGTLTLERAREALTKLVDDHR